MQKQIGHFTSVVIELLGLEIAPGTPIFIGDSNIEHIKSRHPYEYEKYFHQLGDIINAPDYAGINPSDASISFVREFLVNSEYIRVAVRITSKGQYYARSLHLLSTFNAERYIERGTLKKLDK